MFFETYAKIPKIVTSTNFSIIVADPDQVVDLLSKTFSSALLTLEPDDKTGKIPVDAVRDFIASTTLSETSQKFFCVKNAEALNPASENAILKTLEEPKPNHFFVFLTLSPSALLPTILSRAQVFQLKQPGTLTAPPLADDKVKADAKTLIALAGGVKSTKTADKSVKDLISFATTLSKKKDNARLYAQSVAATAIEILYKTYFLTNKEQFLMLLPNFLTLHENLSKNGHIKLQIVASML